MSNTGTLLILGAAGLGAYYLMQHGGLPALGIGTTTAATTAATTPASTASASGASGPVALTILDPQGNPVFYAPGVGVTDSAGAAYQPGADFLDHSGNTWVLQSSGATFECIAGPDAGDNYGVDAFFEGGTTGAGGSNVAVRFPNSPSSLITSPTTQGTSSGYTQ